MVKTLRLSFALKNTYRVNSILYAVKQIPILKRVLPDSLYRIRGFKIFANVLTGIWELLSIFLGKFLYFLTMVCGIGLLYDKAAPEAVFLHILLFLTVIGAFTNTHLFNPTRDKYYAMILLRMDARAYTLSNYAYAMAKVVVGFLPLALLFGLQRGVAWWCCLLLPLAVAGAKLTVAAFSLWDYTRRGFAYNENKLTKYVWLAAGLLLALAYGLPALGVVLPVGVSMAAFGLLIVSGAVSIRTICTFQSYRAVNQELLAQMLQQMDSAKTAAKKTVEKSISADTSITSRRQGFAYLNELFIKRHQKILWKATEKITAVILGLVAVGLLAIRLSTEVGETLNGILLLWLPYFTFIMYSLNRGTGFTRALFMNCDHSLLTYAFFKEPKCILALFRIRLWEIIKINAVPALTLGGGLALLLYASGGTENPLDYAVLVVTILALSVFFSIHYLTIYYLLQPYNAGTELKSGTYSLVMMGTYLVCFFLMNVRLPILVFGLGCIAFCLIYSVVACVLVYRLAPKTFRIRA